MKLGKLRVFGSNRESKEKSYYREENFLENAILIFLNLQ